MNRSMSATGLLALVLTACGRADGTPLTSTPIPSVAPDSIPASPGPTAGISEQEAIEITSDLRANPGMVFESAASGSFGVVGPSDVALFSPDRQVWAVTFAGDVDVGCESGCPKAGTEMVVIDRWTGEFLVSQTHSPQD